MPAPFSGGCACGAIRYQCSAEPVVTGICQCRACQKYSGAGQVFHVGVPRDALTVTGEPKFHDAPADSGNIVSRGFCPDCGSQVLSRNSAMTDLMFVRGASLDDPTWLEPGIAIYTASAQPWDHLDPALPSFPRMPPPQAMPI